MLRKMPKGGERLKKFLLFVLLLLCLSGCAMQEETPLRTAPAAEAPAPESAPQPELAPGRAVMAEGKLLPGGSLYIDGTEYLHLKDLLSAIHGKSIDYGVFRFQHTTMAVRPGSRQIRFQEDNLSDFFSAPVIALKEDLYIPLELCQMLGMGFAEDQTQNLLCLTVGAGEYTVPEGYTVPTLMYHAVGDDLWGYPELFVSPAELEEQLQYLTENGYTTIHFSDLQAVDHIEKPVLLTFDDGYLDNYTELFPLLQKYNCKATIFVITDMLGVHDKYMTWEQAREMADSGLISIQSHTATHPDLDLLTREEQAEQLTRSHDAIFENLGRESYVLCYPTGRYNTNTLELMEGQYTFGLKMAGGDYVTGEPPREIDRWYVPRDLLPGTYADMVG